MLISDLGEGFVNDLRYQTLLLFFPSSMVCLCAMWFVYLDHRSDRRSHIENQLLSICLANARHIAAVKEVRGSLGCAIHTF